MIDLEKLKHTKGPWLTAEWTSRGVFHIEIMSGASQVVVASLECPANDGEAIEATRADAKLIIAAPKMLGALVDLFNTRNARVSSNTASEARVRVVKESEAWVDALAALRFAGVLL